MKGERCTRCHGSLKRGEFVSVYTGSTICFGCKMREQKRPDYRVAKEKYLRSVRKT